MAIGMPSGAPTMVSEISILSLATLYCPNDSRNQYMAHLVPSDINRLSLAGADNPELVVKDGNPWQERFSDANA
jgi:hypothetical protein